MEDTGKKSYRICQISWCLLLPVIMLWLEVRRMGFQTDMLLKLYPPCIFRRVTGMYCPGCGGTRAVVELLKGNILRSLWYHPVVVYTAGLYGWYLISNTIEWISGKRFRIGSRYHRWYGTAAAVLVITNFLLRNILLLFFHITL